MQSQLQISGRSHQSCRQCSLPTARRQPALRCVKARDSLLRKWPDPDFIQEVQEAFHGGSYQQPVANAEEARVLFTNMGYNYLDVRPVTELDDIGRVKGAVHIPKTNVKRVYSPEEGKKVDKAEPNDKFLEQVTKMFPDKEAALLLVADSTGALDGPAIKVLEMLEDEGYENLVGMQGGYAGWNEVWDRKLARRAPKGAYVEDPWAPGASQGVGGGIGG